MTATAKRPALTPVQLAWCQQRMPAFAAAYAAVLRRDADVAANRAQFAKPTEETVNIVSMVRRAT